MRVGLDLRTYAVAKGGIFRYTKRLFEELILLSEESFLPFPNQEIGNIEFKMNNNIELDLPMSSESSDDKYIKLMVDINNIDILFSTYMTLPKLKHTKTILTIHDVVPLIHPEHTASQMTIDYFEKDLYRSAQQVDCIIADSESTKNDIVKYYGVNSEKIKVVYLGCDFILDKTKANSSNALEKYGLIKNQYILSICTIEPRKNLNSVLLSFEEIKQKYPQIKLVLVGALGWKYTDILQAIENHKYKEDIIFTDYIEDVDMFRLYEHALMFVYPSYYEGFGLPILEAMSLGTPVICSNTSSMPEVGGDCVLYCDPYDYRTLTIEMVRLIEDEALRQELSEKGLLRAEKFTWKATAKQVFDIMKSL